MLRDVCIIMAALSLVYEFDQFGFYVFKVPSTRPVFWICGFIYWIFTIAMLFIPGFQAYGLVLIAYVIMRALKDTKITAITDTAASIIILLMALKQLI